MTPPDRSPSAICGSAFGAARLSVPVGLLAAGLLLGAVSPGVAQPNANMCEVPDYLSHVEGRLPRVYEAVAKGRLDILVVGTGSSALAGRDGEPHAYPARLEAALKERLPAVTVTVRTNIASRRSAQDMLAEIKSQVAQTKPNLVIWQTGTVDAMRNVDVDDFRATLERCVPLVRKAGADLMLMNMQYSPRTELMVAVGNYAENMRVAAQQNDVPLFDRLSVMKHWSETGVFDFSGPGPGHVAEQVHDCFGKLLADLIINAAQIRLSQQKAPL